MATYLALFILTTHLSYTLNSINRHNAHLTIDDNLVGHTNRCELNIVASRKRVLKILILVVQYTVALVANAYIEEITRLSLRDKSIVVITIQRHRLGDSHLDIVLQVGDTTLSAGYHLPQYILDTLACICICATKCAGVIQEHLLHLARREDIQTIELKLSAKALYKVADNNLIGIYGDTFCLFSCEVDLEDAVVVSCTSLNLRYLISKACLHTIEQALNCLYLIEILIQHNNH